MNQISLLLLVVPLLPAADMFGSAARVLVELTQIVGQLIGLLIFGFGPYYLIKEKVRSPCYNVGTKGNTGGMVIVAVLENYFCFCRSKKSRKEYGRQNV